MFRRLIKKIQVMQQKKADYEILMSLSNKELQDIGISRGEIRKKIYSTQ
jgi:uncharacterized protein YjiS (DUF1127 family)